MVTAGITKVTILTDTPPSLITLLNKLGTGKALGLPPPNTTIPKFCKKKEAPQWPKSK